MIWIHYTHEGGSNNIRTVVFSLFALIGFIILSYWGRDYKTMHRNLVRQVEENKEEEDVMGVPVCGANLSSPVFDTLNYVREVHYKIGTRLYIENVD